MSSKFPRCVDQTYLDSSARKKSLFLLRAETPLWTILRCLSSTVESQLEQKNYIFGSTGNNSLIQKLKWSLFNENNFPLNFHDTPITPFETFLQGRAFFSHAPFWNDCEMFIVFCSHYETNNWQVTTLWNIRSDSKKSSLGVERPKMFRNKRKPRARNIG